MTTKRPWRFLLCFALIVIAFLCFAGQDTQEANLGKVHADTAPIHAENILNTIEYGTYADTYLESIIGKYAYTENSDKASDYLGVMGAYIYTGKAGSPCAYYLTLNHSKIPGAVGYVVDQGDTSVILAPGTYYIDIDWTSNGTYTTGEIDDFELTVTPKKLDIASDAMYYSNNFENCNYGYKDYWYFTNDSYLSYSLIGDDDAHISWFYLADGAEVEISDTTNVGTYYVYPKLTGENADRYTLNDTAVIYDEMLYDYRDITKEDPAQLTIAPQEITVRVAYDNGEPTPYLLDMYGDYDPIITNYYYYNVEALPFIGYTNIANLTVRFKENAWNYTTNKTYVNEILEVGEYLITTNDFELVSEIEGFANNFKVVNSNCKVTVSKRTFYVAAPTEYSYFNHYSYVMDLTDYGISYGFYTGDEVVPVYEVNPSSLGGGESIYDVIYPEIIINTNSTLRTELSYDMYDTGNIILEIKDDGTHFSFSTNSLTYNWDYMVVPGLATIDVETVQDWFYRQVITDYSKKINVTVSSTDEMEEITVKEIKWSTDGGWTYYTGFPTAGDVENVGGNIYLLVITNETESGKFRETSKIITLDIQKAPVYVRASRDLVYNGEYQQPALTDYLFYIYEPDVNANLWYNVFGCDPDDYRPIINYYMRGGEWIAHTMTFDGKDVGSYYMNASLVQSSGGYEYMYTPLEAHYEIVRDDPEAVFNIVKRNLVTDDIYIQNYNYSNVSYNAWDDEYTATYGDIVHSAPFVTGYTGFVDESYDPEPQLFWYYNTKSIYSAYDKETDISLSHLMTTPGTYWVKSVAVFENYQTVEMNYVFIVKPKVLTIKWYSSQEAYENGEEGIESGNSILEAFHFTYNGYTQYPYYVISGVIDGDATPKVDAYIIDAIYYGTTDAINIGSYRYELKNLTDIHYAFPENYDSCMVAYSIDKKTLTVTPTSGLSKTYGDLDVEFTYTVNGAVYGENPVLDGALSRVAGNKVGNYNITIGDLILTNDDVNSNYTLVLDETPVTFAITPKDITAIFTVVEKEYTSNNIDPDFGSFTGLLGDDIVAVEFISNTINAGSYEKAFKLVGADAGNYVLTSTTVNFTITQATLDYTAVLDENNSTLSVEYDEKSHTLTVTANPATIKINDGGKVYITILTNSSATTAGPYTSKLTISGDKAYNYKFASGKDQLNWTITPKGIDMTAFRNAFAGNTVTYDGNYYTIKNIDSVPTHYSYKYYLNDNLFTGAINVGTYNIEVRFTSDDTTNYPNVPSIYYDLVINQREVSITWGNLAVTYDGYAHLPTTTLNNVAGNDDIDVVLSMKEGVINASNTQVFATGLTGDDADNYKLVGTTQVTMIVSPRDITISAEDKESIYGDEIEKLTVELTGTLAYSDTLESLYTISCNVTNTSGVRDYDIKVNKVNNPNYNITTENGTYNITKRDIEITADDQSTTYGEAIVSPLTARVSDGRLIGTDTIAKLVDITTTATSTSNVGTYVINVSDRGNANYNVVTVNATYTITVRYITVTIANSTSVYGDSKDELTASVTNGNIIGNDNPYTLNCNITKTTSVGEYAITGTKTNNNYSITFVNGSYKVTPRPITVKIDNKTSIYGDGTVELTANRSKGSLANDDLDEEVWTLSCIATNESNVGTYNIEGVSLNNNYAITFVNVSNNTSEYGNYVITVRPITVTIADKTSVYGNITVELTAEVTSSSIVNGDNAYRLNCEVSNLTGIGSYEITGTTLNNNYNITFVNAIYTITARPVTVTLVNKTSVYGDEIVELTREISEGEFINNDEDITLVCDIDTTTGIGDYAITGINNNANYDVTFVNGTYTITKRAITININNQTSVYGDEIVEFTRLITHGMIVNNDDVYTITAKNNEEDIDRTSPIGTYDIVGTCINNNYDVTFNNGAYTITKRPITVTIVNKTSIYGDTPAVLTYSVTTGNIANDDANVYRVNCPVTSASNVGTYDIVGEQLDQNYEITFVNATYTVTQRVVTLTWTNLTFVYDENTHKPTATAGNIKNNDTVVVTVSGEQTVAGTYTATAIALSDNNYKLPNEKTTQFEITKPATYDRPIDVQKVATDGIDLNQIFDNIDTTDENAVLELNIGDATITFNKAAIDALAAGANVGNFKLVTTEGEDAKEIYKKAVTVFEIELDGSNFENGEVTFTTKFENNAPFGKVAKLYYIDAEGNRVNMNAVFENGEVTFTTNHFSTFAVVYTLSTVSIIVIILVVIGALVGVFFILKSKGIIGGKKTTETATTEETTENTDKVKSEETTENTENKEE